MTKEMRALLSYSLSQMSKYKTIYAGTCEESEWESTFPNSRPQIFPAYKPESVASSK